MSIGITELVTRIGDKRVRLQGLDGSIKSLHASKGVTTVTFLTDQPIGLDGTTDLGLVLWLPRDVVAEILKSDKQGLTPNEDMNQN